MRTLVICGIVASALLNGLAIELARGNYFNNHPALPLVAFLCAPAFAIAGLIRFRHRGRPLYRIAILFGAIAASSLMSLIPREPRVIDYTEFFRSYCELLIRDIEAHKETHGSYPVGISEFLARRKPPDTMSARPEYWSDNSTFRLSFKSPKREGGCATGLVFTYDSIQRSWTENEDPMGWFCF